MVMLCADCHISPVVSRHTRCLECQREHLRGVRPHGRRWPYRKEDHAGQRERLREMIAAAMRAGEIRYEQG